MKKYFFLLALLFITFLPPQSKASSLNIEVITPQVLQILTKLDYKTLRSVIQNGLDLTDLCWLTFNVKDVSDLSKKGVPFRNMTTLINEGISQWKSEGMYPYDYVSVKTDGRTITLEGIKKPLIWFGSNSYLNLSFNRKVIRAAKNAYGRFGAGTGASPRIGGKSSYYKTLEQHLSNFFGTESSVIAPSGFAANLAWPISLVEDDDLVLFDHLSHKSTLVGLALVKNGDKHRRIRPFKHNDAVSLEKNIESYLKRSDHGKNYNLPKKIFISVEGIYSMEGDTAKLDKIWEVVQKYSGKFDVYLVIDDAHGIGVTGNGFGTAYQYGLQGKDNVIIMGTLSKSIGSIGGFITGPSDIINWILQNAPSIIFSSGIPPSDIAASIKSLEIINSKKGRILTKKLHKNVSYLVDNLQNLGLSVPDNLQGSIVPVMVPEKVKKQKVRRFLSEQMLSSIVDDEYIPLLRQIIIKEFMQRGVVVNFVEGDAVGGRPRIRISVNSAHTKKDLDKLISVFNELKDWFIE